MKLLSYFVFFIITFQSLVVFSQQKVMVGDTVEVYGSGRFITGSPCNPYCFCYQSQILHFNTTSYYLHKIVKDSAGRHEETGILFFLPKSTGVSIDTVINSYSSDELGSGCGDGGGNMIEYSCEGIDSMTTVKVVYPSVIMPIDTNNSQYLPNNIGAFFSMYNNVSDSSTFSNWQLVMSDSAKLTFMIDTAGTELSSYLMEPFTRKRQLNFTFTTELTPVETERVFSAKLLTTVTKAGKDSVFENALLFRFPPLQPKGVHGMRDGDDVTLSISPNPTDLNTTLLFGHNRSETISIELYDVLGNKRMTLADDIYESGVHTIPINTKDLPQGSYFVRLQTSGQVVTKKLIVQ